MYFFRSFGPASGRGEAMGHQRQAAAEMAQHCAVG